MNTRQLQYVIALAETKSFSEAASKLMISQPSISQYISKLENELGVQIFERTVPLKLTYAGELYVNTARKILKEEAELEERIQELNGGTSGKLKIGTGYLNAIALLPHLIAEYQKAYPNVQIEMYEDKEKELKVLLDEGELDLVVTTGKFDSSSYEKVFIGEEKYIFAVPKTYGFFSEEPYGDEVTEEYPWNRDLPAIDFDKFGNLPIVRLQSDTIMRNLMDSLYSIHQIQPQSIVECTTAWGAYNLVKSGVGATIIPYSTYLIDYSYKVNYYVINELEQKRQIHLVYNKNKYLTDLTKKFIDIGQNYYSDKQQL